MARIARVVAPGWPHHVTQRGNRRQRTFFSASDYRLYLELLAEWAPRFKLEVWAYCLMPNHVHLIVTPRAPDSLARAIGEVHRRYAQHINNREGWRGHLWQSRFASFPMDNAYLLACTRYIELNPVRAKLVRSPRTWAWSSAKAHLTGKTDGLVTIAPLLKRVDDWKAFLGTGLAMEDADAIRSHERTGHPLGGKAFLTRLKKRLGRDVTPRKPGRPVAAKD